jgi:hypothetical protein
VGRGRGGGIQSEREVAELQQKNSEQYKCHKVVEKKQIAKPKEKLTNRGEGDVKNVAQRHEYNYETNMSIMSVKQKKSDCETSTQYCCNMYLTSMKHFTSKAATSKHYCCNMCSIGGYKWLKTN